MASINDPDNVAPTKYFNACSHQDECTSLRWLVASSCVSCLFMLFYSSPLWSFAVWLVSILTASITRCTFLWLLIALAIVCKKYTVLLYNRWQGMFSLYWYYIISVFCGYSILGPTNICVKSPYRPPIWYVSVYQYTSNEFKRFIVTPIPGKPQKGLIWDNECVCTTQSRTTSIRYQI